LVVRAAPEFGVVRHFSTQVELAPEVTALAVVVVQAVRVRESTAAPV